MLQSDSSVCAAAAAVRSPADCRHCAVDQFQQAENRKQAAKKGERGTPEGF